MTLSFDVAVAVRRAKDIASANLTWSPTGQPYTATLTVRYNGKQGDGAFTDPSFTPVLVQLKAFTAGEPERHPGKSQPTGRVLWPDPRTSFDQSYQEVFSFAARRQASCAYVRRQVLISGSDDDATRAPHLLVMGLAAAASPARRAGLCRLGRGARGPAADHVDQCLHRPLAAGAGPQVRGSPR